MSLHNAQIAFPDYHRLIAVDQLEFSIKPWALLQKRLESKYIKIVGFEFAYHKKADGTSNLDFLKLLNLSGGGLNEFEIHSIILERCALRFDNDMYAPASNNFDANHFYINNINTEIALNHYSKQRISAQILNFNFTEETGLKLENLTTQVYLDSQQLLLPRFQIKTTNSYINCDTIRLVSSNNIELTIDSATRINAKLNESYISLSDFKSIKPSLAHFGKKLRLEGMLSGTLDSLFLQNFHASYGNDIYLDGTFQVKQLARHDFDQVYINANINQIAFNTYAIQDIIASAQQNRFLLPHNIHNIGNCHYYGKVSGTPKQLTLNGRLQTNIGSVTTNVQLSVSDRFRHVHLDGQLASTRLRLHKIVPNSQIGDIKFNIKTCTSFGTSTPLNGTVEANVGSLTFRNYNYQNLNFNGSFRSHFFSGEILFDDDNAQLTASGSFDWNKQLPQFNFSAQVNHFSPHKLNLTSQYPDLSIGFMVNSNFSGGDIDNMNGQFSIDSIALVNGDKSYFINTLCLESSDASPSTHQLQLKSDVVNGYIKGQFKLKSLKNNILTQLKRHIPSLIIAPNSKKHTNNFIYQISVARLRELSDFFDAKWANNDSIVIYGFHNDAKNSFAFNLNAPTVSKKGGKISFNDINFALQNNKNGINLTANAEIAATQYATKLNADFNLRNDSMLTKIDWISNKERLFEGEFIAQTHFLNKNNALATTTEILPTQFLLRDSIWDIAHAQIQTDTAITINNLSLSKHNQHLTINGKASKSLGDTLNVQLRNIDLAYISGFIPNEPIMFGGDATGYATVTNTLVQPRFDAELEVPQFSFNNSPWGLLKASSSWNDSLNALDFAGNVTDSISQIAKVAGHYFFSRDSLDIKGSAERLNLDFLNYYLHNITLSAQGHAYGTVHVFGKKKQTTVTTRALAKDAKLTVDYLNTTYSFTDSIILTPDSMLFRNIEFTDLYSHKGKINGYVTHNYFKDFAYNIDIACNNNEAMHTTQRDNPYIFGQIFATGNVNISGNETTGTIIDAQAQSDPYTKVFIPLTTTSNAMDNSFVVFNAPDTVVTQTTIENRQEEPTKLKLQLNIDATPDAEVQIIINPSTGDLLKATGEGNIQVGYDLYSDVFTLRGDYTIETGHYIFTLQNAIRKDFEIQKGSTIRWNNGRAEDAEVDITAVYKLTASLTDIIDKSILENSNRTSVPVNCIMHLTGNLMHPDIAFDITLPNSDDELNRALKSVINTEEMMNRQIVYLLAIGKFLTPDYMRTSAQGELLAIASATLSSQLNNWASQLIDNWNFGINFRSTGEGTDKSNEYEFAFLYTPNDRLAINGNLGYRDDNLSASKFIGDIDAEYKITSNGKIWMKAYNHTNDYKEFKTALTTQGVGLVYRESFSSAKALRKEWQRTIQRNKAEREQRKRARAEKKEQRKAQKEAKKQEKSK